MFMADRIILRADLFFTWRRTRIYVRMLMESHHSCLGEKILARILGKIWNQETPGGTGGGGRGWLPAFLQTHPLAGCPPALFSAFFCAV